jgi:hypothetical protein
MLQLVLPIYIRNEDVKICTVKLIVNMWTAFDWVQATRAEFCEHCSVHSDSEKRGNVLKN